MTQVWQDHKKWIVLILLGLAIVLGIVLMASIQGKQLSLPGFNVNTGQTSPPKSPCPEGIRAAISKMYRWQRGGRTSQIPQESTLIENIARNQGIKVPPITDQQAYELMLAEISRWVTGGCQ